jgi:hypothetical protein
MGKRSASVLSLILWLSVALSPPLFAASGTVGYDTTSKRSAPTDVKYTANGLNYNEVYLGTGTNVVIDPTVSSWAWAPTTNCRFQFGTNTVSATNVEYNIVIKIQSPAAGTLLTNVVDSIDLEGRWDAMPAGLNTFIISRKAGRWKISHLQAYTDSSGIADTRQTFSNAGATVSSGVERVAQTGTMSASRTVTLAAASSYQAGKRILITDESGTVTSANTIIIARAGSDTINGASTSLTISRAYGFVVLESDGSTKYTVTSGTPGITMAAGKALTVNQDTVLDRQASTGVPVEVCIALSDETTAITTGTAKATWRAPWAFTVTSVRASVNTVSSSGLPTVDINETGTTILSTKLTIDASEFTSTSAATAAVISDTAIADDAELTFDVDTAGTGAKGLKVTIYGYR